MVKGVTERHTSVTTSSPFHLGLSIREQVSTAVGSILEGDFTLPVFQIIQQVQSKVPSLTTREAEVAVAAASAAVRRVHAYHQDLTTLKEAGDQSRASSVLARRLVYLDEGPQWPTPAGRELNETDSVLSSPQPAFVEDPGALVFEWTGSGQQREAQSAAPEVQPGHLTGRIVSSGRSGTFSMSSGSCSSQCSRGSSCSRAIKAQGPKSSSVAHEPSTHQSVIVTSQQQEEAAVPPPTQPARSKASPPPRSDRRQRSTSPSRAHHRDTDDPERRRYLDTERTKDRARDHPSSSRASSPLPRGRRGRTPGERRSGSDYDRGERNRRLQRHRERDFSHDRERIDRRKHH